MRACRVLPLAMIMAACLGSPPGAAGGAASPVPDTTLLLEEVEVERVRWPVLFHERRQGACDNLKPADIIVEEDGEQRPVTDSGRERAAALHVLLTDTSGSMTPLIHAVRRTVSVYLDRLPPQDAVMLVGFDQDTILHGPAHAGREALQARLEQLEAGNATALWDALHDLWLYLRDRRERKIVVLLTDGCDSLSQPRHTYKAVLDELSAEGGLTVLPVVVGRATSCPRVSRLDSGIPLAPRSYLEALARRTGGELLEATPHLDLEPAFRGILGRLGREGYIIYKARPAAERRPEGKSGPRPRRVKVRSRRGSGCDLDSAGGDRRRVAAAGEQAVAHLEAAPGRLTGEVEDLVLERGNLYQVVDPAARVPGSERGLALVSRDRMPLTETRLVSAPLPDLEEVLGLRTLADLGLFLLKHAAPGECSGEPPFLVHGRTFLEIRRALSHALMRLPDYGAWAADQLAAERRQEVEAVLEEFSRDAPLAGATVEELRRHLLAAPDHRQPAPERFLAAWLGDIPAARLAAAVERAGANDLLSGVAAAGGPAGLVSRRWPCLAAWFPPPSRRRLVVPLVPLYEAATERLGFYRILLPRPQPGRLPDGRIPDAPVVLDMLRRSASAAAGLQVLDIGYGRADAAGRLAFKAWMKRTQEKPPEFIKSSLGGAAAVLADAAGSSARLEILFLGGSDAACADLVPSAPATVLSPQLGQLLQRLAAMGLRCARP